MRIHFAGNGIDDRILERCSEEPPQDIRERIAQQLGSHQWRLFSYWYARKMPNPGIISKVWGADSTIMDSGLFSLMFGSEKGKLPTTLDAYRQYTRTYLEDLDKWNYRGWLVESDTHRLLGMDATYRLREEFAHVADRTIFVWHMPEGLEGLEKLALTRKYIAVSVPELRMVAGSGVVGGSSGKVPAMVNDLLGRIHSVCAREGVKPPKIHLLGCTVVRMMQTQLAWSCDSTSWLSGLRYGTGFLWDNAKGLRVASIRSPAYKKWYEMTLAKFPLAKQFAAAQTDTERWNHGLASAHAFARCQQWLDVHYSPTEVR